jgi:hypothetical protein
MKKKIKINGKEHTIKTRESYAPKERVVQSKKKYNRNADKKELRSMFGIY